MVAPPQERGAAFSRPRDSKRHRALRRRATQNHSVQYNIVEYMCQPCCAPSALYARALRRQRMEYFSFHARFSKITSPDSPAAGAASRRIWSGSFSAMVRSTKTPVSARVGGRSERASAAAAGCEKRRARVSTARARASARARLRLSVASGLDWTALSRVRDWEGAGRHFLALGPASAAVLT